jgi:hypothetical protein
MKINSLPIFTAFLCLVLATLSCKTLGNLTSKPENLTPQEEAPVATLEPQEEFNESQQQETDTQSESTQPASEENPSQSTDFPLPPGAKNVMNVSGTTNFQVQMELKDIMNYYREEFTKQGLTEDKLLTVTSDSTFSMVFKGAPDGQSIVVQGVDLKNGMSNVSLRYEKI